jgi:hypothetical protein
MVLLSFFVPRVLPWDVFFLRLQQSSFASLLSGYCEFMKKGAGAPREDVTKEDPRNEENKGWSLPTHDAVELLLSEGNHAQTRDRKPSRIGPYQEEWGVIL